MPNHGFAILQETLAGRRLDNGTPIEVIRRCDYDRWAAIGGAEGWTLRLIQIHTEDGHEGYRNQTDPPGQWTIQVHSPSPREYVVRLDPLPADPPERPTTDELRALGAILQLPDPPRSRQIRGR